MTDYFKKLEIFQKSFNSTFNEQPTLLAPKDFELRYKLMKEENEEYLQASQDGNLVEVADALGDQLFILLGTIVSNGMQSIIKDVFNEITASNMSKLDENGKPIINGQNGVLDENIAIGKVLKSPNYWKPNLEKIFEKYENVGKPSVNLINEVVSYREGNYVAGRDPYNGEAGSAIYVTKK